MASTDENRFYDDCLLIDPKEANLFDLFGLLFSSDLERRRFIYRPKHEKQNFLGRWIMFVSVLVQKLLNLADKPIAVAGFVIETSLNLLSCNGGFFSLLLNLMTGKLVWPHKSSAKFRSLISHADPRVDLGKKFKPGDIKYKALLCMMSSKFSYENEAYIQTNITQHWKMKFLKFYNFWNDFEERFTTQAFMAQDTRSNPNLFVVAFRGTQPFAAHDWGSDIGISWYELKDAGMGKIHSGFMKALGLQKNKGWPFEIKEGTGTHQFAYYTLRQEVRKVLQENREAKFIVTGHSMGAALAILFASVLILHEEEWLLEKLEAVYTFGQPRVGDHKFAEFMKRKLSQFDVKYYRFVYSNDLVPRVPYDDHLFFYKHIGPCIYFNSFFKAKVMSDAPHNNYYPGSRFIQKMVNAIWELIRGFILPYWKGPEYRESWVLLLARMMISLPGLRSHVPADYVHCTRIGNYPTDIQLPDSHKHLLKRD